jgi:hypothetical protein
MTHFLVILASPLEPEPYLSGLIISKTLSFLTGLTSTTTEKQSKWEQGYKVMRQWQPRKPMD